MTVDKAALPRLIGIALAAAFIFFLLDQTPPFQLLEKQFLDHSFRIRGAQTSHPDIAIVEITDESLARVGSWPWPRSYHARLLEQLRRYEPSVIFFDFLFSEPSVEEEDLIFAYELGKTQNVILPYYFPSSDRRILKKEPAGLPIPAFRENVRHMGFVNTFPDDDGHVREMELTVEDGATTYYIAALMIGLVHEGPDSRLIEKFSGRGPIILNYPGPYENFNRIRYDTFTTATPPKEALPQLRSLKGKIVLVGHTATGTALDLKPSPFSPLYPGIGLQASAVHTLLTGTNIRRTPKGVHLTLLFLTALLIFGFSRHRHPLHGLGYTALYLTVFFILIQILFRFFYLWVPFAGVLIMGVLLYAGYTLFEFFKTQMERQILSRELELASAVQNSLLPASFPKIAGYQIAATSKAARRIGGDFYDIVSVMGTRLGVSLADVSGKGIPAALLMARAISEFRREALDDHPAATLSRLNDRFARAAVSGSFLTMAYLVLDPEGHTYQYASGGHETAFMYRKAKNEVVAVPSPEGLPLGVMEGADFGDIQERFQPGDILVLQSDGIKEAKNTKKELFGNDRLKKAILEASAANPSSVIDHITKCVEQFTAGAVQNDDRTLVCIKRVG